MLMLIGFAALYNCIMHVKFEWRMLPASRNGLIIGALCCEPKDDDDICFIKMSSGVTSVSGNGVGHCSFSGLPIKKEKCLRAEYDTR